MTDFLRHELAEEQARLVRALTGGDAPPGGFDPIQLQTAALALLAKRRRGVEKAWPALIAARGANFSRDFSDYAAQFSLSPFGIKEDALCFARHLAQRRLLPLRLRIIVRLRSFSSALRSRHRG